MYTYRYTLFDSTSSASNHHFFCHEGVKQNNTTAALSLDMPLTKSPTASQYGSWWKITNRSFLWEYNRDIWQDTVFLVKQIYTEKGTNEQARHRCISVLVLFTWRIVIMKFVIIQIKLILTVAEPQKSFQLADKNRLIFWLVRVNDPGYCWNPSLGYQTSCGCIL